jgi:hypothetical protein
MDEKELSCIVIDEATEVVILDESTGVTDRTHRPVTGARLQALKDRLAKEAELRRLMEADKKQNGSDQPQA